MSDGILIVVGKANDNENDPPIEAVSNMPTATTAMLLNLLIEKSKIEPSTPKAVNQK